MQLSFEEINIIALKVAVENLDGVRFHPAWRIRHSNLPNGGVKSWIDRTLTSLWMWEYNDGH